MKLGQAADQFGFNPLEKRGEHGRWTVGGSVAKKAGKALDFPGEAYDPQNKQHVKAAYNRLTEKLRTMHTFEKSDLHKHEGDLNQALYHVHNGEDKKALALTDKVMSSTGDKWRAAKGVKGRHNPEHVRG